MSELDEIFDKRRTELDETADRLADSFNLRNLDEDTLHSLSYAIGNVLREKRNESRNKKLDELKEKYQGKYFFSEEIGLCFVEEIIDEYKFKGWQICTFDPDEILDLDRGSKCVFKKGFISEVLADRLSLKGNTIDTAPIKMAEEWPYEKAEKYLEEIFSNIKKDYLK